MRDVLPLVQDATGRCHSCSNRVRYDIPSGAKTWCRVYSAEMSQAEAEAVRNCPRWRPLRKHNRSLPPRLAGNQLLASLLEEEDRLFASLRLYLADSQVDLRSLIIIARPHETENLDWLDRLEDRFGLETHLPVDELLNLLAERGHDEIVSLARPILII